MKPYYCDNQTTLYLGDCLENTEWLDADVLVTDPPYGMNHAPRGTYQPTTGRTLTSQLDKVHNDNSTDTRDAVLNMWGSRPAIVFGTWRQERPKDVAHRLIWHKRGQPPGPAKAAFMLQDEEIYILGSGFKPSSPPLRSVIATNEVRQGAAGLAAVVGHPTPKPVPLMELLIMRCPDGVIADPFAGSGATLLAARNQNRKAIGVELEEKYCEIIARRLDQMCLDFG